MAPGSSSKSRKTMIDQPAAFAILGLLHLNGGQAYGYELMRRFTAPDLLADILHLSQSMLYQHLKRLHAAGLLTFTTEAQASRPPRQMCRLTAEGTEKLESWIGAPVAHVR